MNLKLFACFAAGSAVTFLTMMLIAAAPVEVDKLAGLGPFRLERTEGTAFFVIDTRDGHVWWKTVSSNWNDQGVPPTK